MTVIAKPAHKHRLQPAWQKGSYRDRFEAVRPYVEGKRVLDLGCAVGHKRPDWFHGQLTGIAAQISGVDRDEATVEMLRARGEDLEVGDASHLDLGRTFDVIFAGELIEHLDNFHGFLDSVRRHLETDGVLVLTTPNAFGFSEFLYRFSKNAWVNPEHTCWFCEDTIRQLLQRNGFDVVDVRYVRHRTPGLARRLFAGTIRALLPDRLAWNTLLVVAKPAA